MKIDNRIISSFFFAVSIADVIILQGLTVCLSVRLCYVDVSIGSLPIKIAPIKRLMGD